MTAKDVKMPEEIASEKEKHAFTMLTVVLQAAAGLAAIFVTHS